MHTHFILFYFFTFFIFLFSYILFFFILLFFGAGPSSAHMGWARPRQPGPVTGPSQWPGWAKIKESKLPSHSVLATLNLKNAKRVWRRGVPASEDSEGVCNVVVPLVCLWLFLLLSFFDSVPVCFNLPAASEMMKVPTFCDVFECFLFSFFLQGCLQRWKQWRAFVFMSFFFVCILLWISGFFPLFLALFWVDFFFVQGWKWWQGWSLIPVCLSPLLSGYIFFLCLCSVLLCLFPPPFGLLLDICIYSARVPSLVRNQVSIKLILFFEVWILLRIKFESR